MNHVHLKIASLLAACAALSGCFDEAKLLTAPATPDTAGYIPAYRVDSLPVAITEICPGNDDLLDEFGDDPGWIEIANLSSDTVDLGRYRLRPGTEGTSGWRLPDTLVPPGGTIAVFMSGRDIRTPQKIVAPVKTRLLSVYAWYDAMEQELGVSEVVGDRFGTALFKRTGADFEVSAKIKLAENGLDWSGANLNIGLRTVDASLLDRVVMKGTFPAGQVLMVRACSDDAQCWKHSAVPLTGTGMENDLYEFPLSRFRIDSSVVTGFQFDPPANLLGTYSLYVSGIELRASRRHAHADFKLKRKGGRLFLEDTAGETLVALEYPAIPARHSWIRNPANGKWDVHSIATPGLPNPMEPDPAIRETPRFLTTPGFHPGSITVKTAPIPGLVVRCDTGGRIPTFASKPNTDGLRLDSTNSVSCAAFSASGSRGPVATATFLVGGATRLPVVSLTVDPSALFDPDTGIYSMGAGANPNYPNFGANFWSDKELAANVELFDGGIQAFSLPAGMAIFGNWTRSEKKKGISIQFREKYGVTEMDWPLYPHHPQYRKFKGFAMRANGSNSSVDYVRDGMMQSFMEPRGLEYQYSRHAVFYINGRYWGIYEIRERLDPDYLDTRFGLDKSNVELVKNNSEIQAGTLADWNEVRETLQGLAATDSAGWSAMAKRIDFDAFTDYCIAELYSGNDDWPANNIRVWRRKNPSGPWRPMLFDLDGGLGGFRQSHSKNPFPHATDSSRGWDDYPNGPGSNVVLRRILSHPDLKNRFINRFLVQLATNLSATSTLRAMDSILATIREEIPRDVARWEFDPQEQEIANQTIRTFLQKRPEALQKSMKSFFKLDSTTVLNLSATGGTIRIEDIAVGTSYSGPHYRGVPVVVEAVPSGGRAFLGWSDGTAIARRVLVPGTDPTTLVARFE